MIFENTSDRSRVGDLPEMQESVKMLPHRTAYAKSPFSPFCAVVVIDFIATSLVG